MNTAKASVDTPIQRLAQIESQIRYRESHRPAISPSIFIEHDLPELAFSPKRSALFII